MQNAFNISTAKDILRLSVHCARNKLFRQVVNAQNYLYVGEGRNGERAEREWKNTNKLLEMGWEGIKTGQTPTAGSCLSSLRDNIYIVVLNSPNSETRFTDTQKLYSWYRRQYYPSSEDSKEHEKAVRLESCPTLDSI